MKPTNGVELQVFLFRALDCEQVFLLITAQDKETATGIAEQFRPGKYLCQGESRKFSSREHLPIGTIESNGELVAGISTDGYRGNPINVCIEMYPLPHEPNCKG